MLRTETIKQINAAETSAKLMNEAGIDGGQINISNVPDAEVEQVAIDNKVVLNRPTYMVPYMWCAFTRGNIAIHINGKRKNIKLLEVVE